MSVVANVQPQDALAETVSAPVAPVGAAAPPPQEAPEAASRIGERVGSYILRRLIGSGGMGEVYEAVHEFIGQQAAIKLLKPSLSSDRTVAQRFINEARAVSIVEHPGLVRIYGYDRLPDGTAYLVMELLKGESLRSRLKRLSTAGERMRPATAIGIARHLALALRAAHGAEIVHCDLKPDNIFLSPNPAAPGGERVKVLDFGIAKFLSGSAGHQTTEGLILGTPRYMSPEQCEGRDKVDSKVDVYALGVILFEMLAGMPPFHAESSAALMRQHMTMDPPSLRSKWPAAPDDLCALIEQMLAKDGASRPSMDQVQERLAAETLLEETGKQAATAQQPATARLTGLRRPRRPVVLLGVSALLALLGVGIAVWVSLPLHRPPAPAPGTTSAPPLAAPPPAAAPAPAPAQPTAQPSAPVQEPTPQVSPPRAPFDPGDGKRSRRRQHGPGGRPKATPALKSSTPLKTDIF